MHDIETVEVGDSTDNLFEVPTGLGLLDLGVLDNIIKELAVLDVLHD